MMKSKKHQTYIDFAVLPNLMNSWEHKCRYK